MATSQLHEDFSREEEVKAGTDRGFGFVFAGFFAIVAAISLWRGGYMWHYTLPLSAAFFIRVSNCTDLSGSVRSALARGCRDLDLVIDDANLEDR